MKHSEWFRVAFCVQLLAQAAQSKEYGLSLPDHKGRLTWSIDGYTVIENSAKPSGSEIGIRGRNSSGRVTFSGFLFLVPEIAPASGKSCREGALVQAKKAVPTLRISKTEEVRTAGSAVALATYSTANRDGSPVYRVRGFIASGDICGDLEFYSSGPLGDDDSEIRAVFRSFHLDVNYTPQFVDVLLYAQILFQHQNYRAAAPVFEKALAMVPSDGGSFKSAKIARRILRDQAGMSYGIAGDLAKARTIFERGIVDDPDYPMYYYNLACADAGEKKLASAKVRLQQAFERKANVNPGEAMPVPSQDDSFLPYKGNSDFWAFLERLQTQK